MSCFFFIITLILEKTRDRLYCLYCAFLIVYGFFFNGLALWMLSCDRCWHVLLPLIVSFMCFIIKHFIKFGTCIWLSSCDVSFPELCPPHSLPECSAVLQVRLTSVLHWQTLAFLTSRVHMQQACPFSLLLGTVLSAVNLSKSYCCCYW